MVTLSFGRYYAGAMGHCGAEAFASLEDAQAWCVVVTRFEEAA